MSRTAVIIPTRNRVDDLARCLASLAAQERRPDLVVVSDAGDTGDTRELCRRVSGPGALAICHVPAGTPGITRQRNLGLARLPRDMDFVMFCDDDVTLDPGYLARLVDFLERPENAGVAGAGGIGAQSPPRGSAAFHVYVSAFGLGSRTKAGQWLRSGVNIPPPGRGPARRVDWLFGCAVYRMSQVEGLRFSEELTGYGAYEDVDFSRQAAARGVLVTLPSARLVHHQSRVGRQDLRSAVAMRTVNRHWLLRRHGRPGWRLAYWWSIVGLFVLEASRAGLRRRGDDRARLAGLRAGVAHVLRGGEPR